MTYKKWIITTCALGLIIPALTAGFNYFMDPLWCFPISHRFNQKQDDFNERQQKANYIAFHDFDYDALIIGSSTSTNLNQYRFSGLRAYNLSINALQPREYIPYISYARERNGKDFRRIFMGLDFIQTADNVGPPPYDAVQIIEETRNPLYRIKMLVSLGTLKFSRRNFMNYLYGRHIYYDRRNVKYSTKLDRRETEFNMTRLMDHFENADKPYSFKKYRFNGNYRALIAKTRAAFPGTRFVVYTTPVIQPYLTMMVRYGLLDTYERWIRDIVDVYGECYNFMIPGPLADDYMNSFHDPNHYYPFVADRMIDAIHGSGRPEASGICMHITRANLEEKLALLRKRFIEAAART